MAIPARKAAQIATPATEMPVREPVREDVHQTHTSDGRVVARSRSGATVSRTNVGSFSDIFHVPPDFIPPGWSW